ncbi:MAG: pimeloyl-ACP methyl ester carboxylesterase [Phenylobacterium sp.]|jgi:pimeloyl-ACP methyl ester carboxylesterase
MHKIQFSHANGLPSSTYSYLFDRLDNTEITFVEKMGHADYPVEVGFERLADELIASIEQNATAPVVGMGHSAGGVVTLLAASKRPELFSKLILLDPVFFSKRKRFALWLARRMGLADSLSPVKRTLVRKNQFDHHQQASDYFSGKTLFKNFHPACFKDYIKHGLTPVGSQQQGFELAFSRLIEADIFRSVATKVPANRKQLTGILIYGRKSDMFWASDARWWQKNYPGFTIMPFDGGHLFPLEQPDEVGEMVNQYLKKRQ